MRLPEGFRSRTSRSTRTSTTPAPGAHLAQELALARIKPLFQVHRCENISPTRLHSLMRTRARARHRRESTRMCTKKKGGTCRLDPRWFRHLQFVAKKSLISLRTGPHQNWLNDQQNRAARRPTGRPCTLLKVVEWSTPFPGGPYILSHPLPSSDPVAVDAVRIPGGSQFAIACYSEPAGRRFGFSSTPEAPTLKAPGCSSKRLAAQYSSEQGARHGGALRRTIPFARPQLAASSLEAVWLLARHVHGLHPCRRDRVCGCARHLDRALVVPVLGESQGCFLQGDALSAALRYPRISGDGYSRRSRQAS